MRFHRSVGAGLVGLLVALGAVGCRIGQSDEQAASADLIKGGSSYPPLPAPAEEVSFAEAASRFGLPIPLLPPMTLPDVCGGQAAPLTFQTAFVSPEGEDELFRQLALVYSHGVVVMVHPAGGTAEVGLDGELVPASAFSDFPPGLDVGTFNGHVAYKSELPTENSCSMPSPTSNPEIEQFPVTQLAGLSWAENGLVVDIQGPYSLSQIEDMAGAATWERPGPAYGFEGFLPPIGENEGFTPAVGGRAVPVRFSLDGDEGLDIFKGGSPTVQELDCVTGEPVAVEESAVSPGRSGLSHDATNGIYTYVWKTDKSWAGTCRRFSLGLADHSLHLAGFRFR